MGKFTRLKKPLTKTKKHNAFQPKDTTPITTKEHFQIDRWIALKMIPLFGLKDWMKPYLTETEWTEHLPQWRPDIPRIWV